MPSLVVCPTSVVSHWKNEILKFVDNLAPIIYHGKERSTVLKCIDNYDVLIMSYETLRNDILKLRSIHFNYCVLDEGHIIKNSVSKITIAAKMINAEHRLILSGTPVQNNVLELWSLFDFLMPNFLGTEDSFRDKYVKPITALKSFSVHNKKSKKLNEEQIEEQGSLALESLHKQVLPFLLRRLKEDVLDDLPPKIIQDYLCEMTDLQRLLYGDYCSKQSKTVEDDLRHADDEDKGSTHIFQAL